MSGGLAALLDDVALIARKAAAAADDVTSLAAKTSTKAAAVVVDDAAVTPRYVQGIKPARELPMVWRIARGSLFNKLVVILPIALLLSWIAPWALTPLLMLGGAYLVFEGAEKILEFLLGHGHGDPDDASKGANKDSKDEDSLVKGAIRTDLILSAEIMVISLNEVADRPFLLRTAVLIVIAFLITAAVYGSVALLVKLDDVGLNIAEEKDTESWQSKLGMGMVKLMPKIMSLLAIVGTFAMLWVGGHILVVGLAELGWHLPEELVKAAAGFVESAGSAVVWLVETIFYTLVGFLVGAIIAGIVTGIHKARSTKAEH